MKISRLVITYLSIFLLKNNNYSLNYNLSYYFKIKLLLNFRKFNQCYLIKLFKANLTPQAFVLCVIDPDNNE